MASEMAVDVGEKQERLPVTVSKPIPLEFDLGELFAFDTNPLDPTSYESSREACLKAVARDGAQLLINQILTTVPLKSTPDGVFAELPDPLTALPREKPLPKPKEPTKWDLFAKKKGIVKSNTNSTGKMVYDEATGEWVPKWGYKGKNKAEENQWLVEVNDKKATKPGQDADNPRALSRQERMDRIKKNERQEKKNIKHAAGGAKVLGPKPGSGAGKNRRK
ncbi:ribosome biogenesis regulatory protein-domain-containing protein [Peziza echinospora]|nr:ribosome biogenesis regulatory protein-domain-containing protein [Peziza echinospora]